MQYVVDIRNPHSQQGGDHNISVPASQNFHLQKNLICPETLNKLSVLSFITSWEFGNIQFRVEVMKLYIKNNMLKSGQKSLLQISNVVRLSQLEAQSDLEKFTSLTSPEGDGVAGLQSHVESPGA